MLTSQEKSGNTQLQKVMSELNDTKKQVAILNEEIRNISQIDPNDYPTTSKNQVPTIKKQSAVSVSMNASPNRIVQKNYVEKLPDKPKEVKSGGAPAV